MGEPPLGDYACAYAQKNAPNQVYRDSTHAIFEMAMTRIWTEGYTAV